MLTTGAVALLLLILVIGLLNRIPAPATLIPSPTPTPADQPVALVDGQPIRLSFWAEAVLLDWAMSRLAGVPAPTPQETLDRLINEVLVLRAAPQPSPGQEEVEARIAALQEAWGASDEQMAATLGEFGLNRQSLERAVARLIMVQQAQAVLESQGTSIQDWLSRERSRAHITIYPERIQVSFLTPIPTATLVVTSTPEGIRAPDFSLERANGGTFTLSEQTARGPVVLVFFQRCG